MDNRLIILLGFVFFISCNKKIKTLTVSNAVEVDEIATVRSDKKEECDCRDPNNYVPDPRFSVLDDIKYIRVNFHYPNDSSRDKNYTGEEAITYSKDLLSNANRKVKTNKKMTLPEGNDTPVYDGGYRLKLMEDKSTSSGFAIYEDIDDEDWYYIKKGKGKNNYSKTIIRKHAVHDDTILNIFAMVYPPDSLGSKTFKSGAAGIAMGTSLKIAGVKETNANGAWKLAALLNHEVGHVFGLKHSWYKNDGCDDTPSHPNCWSRTKDGKCAGPVSNNMMDYNPQQIAISPCQIGIVKKNMHRTGSKARRLVEKDWCDYDPLKNLVITENTNLDRAIDMKGDIIIEGNASLRLSCRVHLPKGARIIVHPEATLILNGAKLHNDCGEKWGGIELLSKGKQTGKIEYLGDVTIDNLEGDIDESNQID